MIVPINVINQSAFRFRNDDGSETTATWKAAKDTNIAASNSDLNVNIRLRIATDNLTNPASISRQLRVSIDSASYQDVNASSTHVRSSASSNITNDAATTQQIGPSVYTFIAGVTEEVDGLTPSLAFGGDEYAEDEFCFQLRSADFSAGVHTIDFRLYNTATPYDTYISTPRITLTVTSGSRLADLFFAGQ